MSTASKSFTATGAGVAVTFEAGTDLTLDVSGTFVGTVQLQRSLDMGQSWASVRSTVTGAATDYYTVQAAREMLRYFCTAYTSGTIVTSISQSAADVVSGFNDSAGVERLQVVNGGVRVDGTLKVTGAVTNDSTVTNTGALTQTGAAAFAAGLSVLDGSLSVKNTSDPTKIVKLSAAGLTTATTRTITVPDATDTMVLLAATQTLTNKTLTTPTLNSAAAVTPTVTSPATATPAATDATLGAVAAPASGTTAVTIERWGSFFRLNFTLTAARIPVTDDGASGSFGSLKLFDFAQQALQYLSARQNYTAFAEGALLTGAAGDAAFTIGIGDAAIVAAADKVLTSAQTNLSLVTLDITLSGGTGVGTKIAWGGDIGDGTDTAKAIYLNWSGSAATIDASDYIDVTGTISVVGVMLGDD